MVPVIVTKPFAFAHRGIEVEQFEPSDEPRETTEEVAEWLAENGYGRRADAAAPENKDAASKRSRKGA